MNFILWLRPIWNFLDDNWYIVTFSYCKNRSIQHLFFVNWLSLILDYKYVIYRKIPFKGFKIVTTHEGYTVSCAGVQVMRQANQTTRILRIEPHCII